MSCLEHAVVYDVTLHNQPCPFIALKTLQLAVTDYAQEEAQ